MFDRIRRLGSETAIYGISTILGRFLTFLLTPVYTHVLLREDLGVTANTYAYIAFFNVIYGYGMEAAYMKYVSTLEIGNRRQVFTVPFLSVVCTSTLFSVVLILLRHPVAAAAAIPGSMVSIVVFAALILALDAAALIPFAALRMANRARWFALLKFMNIVINVICNLVFLLCFHLGVEGVFLAGVIASCATLLMLLPVIVRSFSLQPARGLYRALLRFGLPYVPAGLASIAIQVVSRPILESLSGLAAVGVYQANYRLGIFMMLLVSMFDFAWRPFFLTEAAKPDARPLFARIMTYSVLLMTLVFLGLSFFLGDIVRAPLFWGKPLIAEPYWSGLTIVPVILLAYLFLGVYNNLVAGIYIEKKTQQLPLVTFVGAGVSIGATYLLVPVIGLMGAAVATLLSYVTMAGLLFVIVQRVYPVPYEYGRLARIAVAGTVVYALYQIVDTGPIRLVWGGFLLVGFVGMMALMRFFLPSELAGVQKLLRRTPSTPV